MGVYKRLVFILLCVFALSYELQLFMIIVQERIGRLFSNVLHNHQVAAQMPLQKERRRPRSQKCSKQHGYCHLFHDMLMLMCGLSSSPGACVAQHGSLGRCACPPPVDRPTTDAFAAEKDRKDRDKSPLAGSTRAGADARASLGGATVASPLVLVACGCGDNLPSQHASATPQL